MRLEDLAPVDVREPLVAQRARLVELLGSLDDDQWGARTAAPEWSVKDLSLHLLDVDLSWLTHGRDRDRSGMIEVTEAHDAFVRGLSDRNQRWVEGARILSPRLIVELLAWAGEQLTDYLASLDLSDRSSVYWAGDVPLWFDLAREFTERWVHGRQIEEAAFNGEAHDLEGDDSLSLVIRTFIWAFPHQYREAAPTGTVVAIEVSGVDSWTLTRTGDVAGDGWILDQGVVRAPTATLHTTGDAAWRLLTDASYEPDQVRISGRTDLAEPLLGVRSIIV